MWFALGLLAGIVLTFVVLYAMSRRSLGRPGRRLVVVNTGPAQHQPSQADKVRATETATAVLTRPDGSRRVTHKKE